MWLSTGASGAWSFGAPSSSLLASSSAAAGPAEKARGGDWARSARAAVLAAVDVAELGASLSSNKVLGMLREALMG